MSGIPQPQGQRWRTVNLACSVLRLCFVLSAAWSATAQQAGGSKNEVHVPLGISRCAGGACSPEAASITMDSNWRWLHSAGGFKNCVKKDGSGWDSGVCADPASCAKSCQIDGADMKAYTGSYGVTPVNNGVRIAFPNGPRLYVMDTDTTYKIFKLKNREFTFDVDLSTIPCGANAALYFVEMPQNGGMDGSLNTAGAKLGTGYCDAQCPHMQFIPGHGANMESWTKHPAKNPDGQWLQVGPQGPRGVCCAEMDIMEANRHTTAWTVHPCDTQKQHICQGDEDCGNVDKHLPGVCDKMGCGWNPYRLGSPKFFGAGAAFSVDTSRPFTVVTQFVTSDGTDQGDLAEIRQTYVQDGKIIPNPKAEPLLNSADSITTPLCDRMTVAYHTNKSEPVRNDFKQLGGLPSMGRALDRGMVLVFSIWDDDFGRMLWLDGEYTSVKDDPKDPGVRRGPCGFHAGNDAEIQAKAKQSPISVTFSNIKHGALGSTSVLKSVPKPPPSAASSPAVPSSVEGANATAPTAASGHAPAAASAAAAAAPSAGSVTSNPSSMPRQPNVAPAPAGIDGTALPLATPYGPAPMPQPSSAAATPAVAPVLAPSSPVPQAPAAAPVAAAPAAVAPPAASWTVGCEWIPKDNCLDTNSVACNCRKLNPSGPCPQCPSTAAATPNLPSMAPVATPALAVTLPPTMTPGCEWIPRDNCQDSNAVACSCRAKNPSGPCTACPNSRPKQAAASLQRKFDGHSPPSIADGGAGVQPFALRAGMAALAMAATFVTFVSLRRQRRLRAAESDISSVMQERLPRQNLWATDEETLLE
mmetsp:Transcript_58460/g.115916  ORF Transcript_58460/g.115916 Transcript_58460/m.115916 type:complete len:810 (+) Transcript_58460:58-2487(+)